MNDKQINELTLLQMKALEAKKTLQNKVDEIYEETSIPPNVLCMLERVSDNLEKKRILETYWIPELYVKGLYPSLRLVWANLKALGSLKKDAI